MFRISPTFFLVLCLTLPALGQKQAPAPETPRQAILEILFTADPSAQLRRLPSSIALQLAAHPDFAEDMLRGLMRARQKGG